MHQNLLLIPVFLMVALTSVVWLRMIAVRTQAMKAVRLHPEKMKSQAAKPLLPEAANIPAENFANQFEVPVLFYVLVGFIYVTESFSIAYLAGLLAYVVFRLIHSLIALTYNRVVHRFLSYLMSCLILWTLWIVFTLEISSKLWV